MSKNPRTEMCSAEEIPGRANTAIGFNSWAKLQAGEQRVRCGLQWARIGSILNVDRIS